MAASRLTCSVVILSLFLTLTVAQSIAPGDAFRYCLNRPGRVPTFSNEKILLDTQNYNSTKLLHPTGMNRTWLNMDLDGGSITTNSWYDSNQGIDCHHNLTVCSNEAGQNNWMVTQYINISISEVDRLVINVTFSSNLDCGTCGHQTFEIWTYETNEVNETGRGNNNLYTYAGVRLVHTAASGLTYASDSFAVSQSGLYMAVVDGGACSVVTRIALFYHVCPYRVLDMVVYPETVSPTGDFSSDIPVTATCIDNASPSGGLQLQCRRSGVWFGTVSCTCNEGYEQVNMTTCVACPEGTFKSGQGNNSPCEDCPDNSTAVMPGLGICSCMYGFYRANGEGPSVACTAPPSPPLNLHNISVSRFTINITWTTPNDNGGRNDITYTVTILVGNSIQQTFNTTITSYSFSNLVPSTTYIIRVLSRNGVSDQESSTDYERTVNISVVTLNSLSSHPQSVSIEGSTTGQATILSWSPPSDTFGTLVGYLILVNTVNDTDTAEVKVELTPTTDQYDLSSLDIPSGTYYVWVRAETEHGAGDYSLAVKYRHQQEANLLPVIVGSVSGFVVLLIIIIIAVIIVIVVIIAMSGRKKISYNVGNINYDHEGVMELGTIVSSDNPNRMYIDPRTYASMNQAFQQNAVREIPPKEITSMDEIGVGEFGLVYKAVWTLKNVSVAVKTLRGGATDEQRDNFLFEASVMGQFHHDNVVTLFGVISRVDPVMIVMEFLQNGSLDRYLQKNLDRIDKERLATMAYGVSKGMDYLSKIGYVHRDLAARNILVAKDETCKVADFGLTRELVDNEYDVNKGGRIPVRWTAPEAISHRSFTQASDVWSFGVLLWEIYTFGETPYEGWDNVSIFQRLENGERLHQPRNCPDDIYQMMLSCWNAERSERPSFEELVSCFEVILFGKPKPKPKPKHLQSPNRDPPPPPLPPVPSKSNGVSGMKIDDLLGSISMTRYVDLFHQHGYHMVSDCFELSEDDLQRMGVSLSGHQYKIVKNIRLKEEELGRVSPDYI